MVVAQPVDALALPILRAGDAPALVLTDVAVATRAPAHAANMRLTVAKTPPFAASEIALTPAGPDAGALR